MSTVKDNIKKLQQEIREKQKEIINLRQSQSPEEIKDYKLTDLNGNKIMLSTLFGDDEELLVVHNMGKECRYCTMWADGLRGFTEVISDRMPWVLVSPNDHATLKTFSESRNWNFDVLSFEGSEFGKDLGYESESDGVKSFMPGASALIKKDGKIYRVGNDFFGPGDNYNSVWHFFDLFPKGSNGWQPKYVYSQKKPEIDLLN